MSKIITVADCETQLNNCKKEFGNYKKIITKQKGKIYMNTIIFVLLSLFGIFITIALPIIACLYSTRKYGGTSRPFVYGILAFLISQLLIRIPLMNYLSINSVGYQKFSLNVIPFSIVSGFTAGLFEETARFIMFGLLLKEKRRNVDGIIFGFGHGGLEAAYFIGVNLLYTLIALPVYKLFGLDFLPAALISPGLESFLDIIDVMPIGTLFVSIFPAIYERIVVILIHIGLTMIILTGFQKAKPFRYYLLAILIHTLVDAPIGFFQIYTSSPVLASLIYITIIAIALTVFVIIHCKKSIKNN